MSYAAAAGAAVLVVLAAIIIYCVATALLGRGAEGLLVSPEARAVHAKATDLFKKRRGRVTFSEYRTRIPGADPVQFSDVWRLHLRNQLTAEMVQAEVFG